MAHRVQQAPCLVGSGARDGVTPHLRPDAAAMHDPPDRRPKRCYAFDRPRCRRAPGGGAAGPW